MVNKINIIFASSNASDKLDRLEAMLFNESGFTIIFGSTKINSSGFLPLGLHYFDCGTFPHIVYIGFE